MIRLDSRRLFCLPAAVLLVILSMGISYATDNVQGSQWITLECNQDGVYGRFYLHEWEIVEDEYGQRVSIDGGLVGDDPLPRYSTWITVPNGFGVTAELFVDGDLEPTGIHYLDAIGMEPHVLVGEPAIFRGVRVFPITIVPVSVHDDGMVQISNEMVLEIDFDGGDDRATVDEGPVPVTMETRRFIEANVLNVDEIELVDVAPLGRMVVVVENDNAIRSAIQPYLKWKTEQGYPITVVSPANTQSFIQIKELIQAEYDSEDPIPLEYVLIIGDDDGSIDMTSYNDVTDHWYTRLDGNDILSDAAIGRFSVQSITELMRVTNKTLAYERDVDLNDTDWLENATLTSGGGSGITPIQTNRTLKRMLVDHGIDCDTLWFTMEGNIPNFIVSSINMGASWVNYRGFYGMSGWNQTHADACFNGSHLPIFVTITCGTGTFATQTTSQSEGIFRAGTGVNTFKCGVVCLGTATTGTHTRFNNVVDLGFFEAPLNQNVRTTGWALVNGKMRLYQAFNGVDNVGVINFSNWNNLMGDPALRTWIGVPDEPEVNHPETRLEGTNYIDVELVSPSPPPEFAWATITSDNEILDSRRFHPDGTVRLEFENANSVGDIRLTVCGDNLAPYQEDISEVESDIFVGYFGVLYIDGNDSEPNPNETLSLLLSVNNFGSEDTEVYDAELVCADPRLTILQGEEFQVPALTAGHNSIIQTPVQVRTCAWVSDGAEIPLELIVHGPVDFHSTIPFHVSAWTATAAGDPIANDEDNILSPGEEARMVFTILNDGREEAVNLTGTVTTSNDYIEIIDAESTFEQLTPGEMGDNSIDPFIVGVNSAVPVGERLEFIVELEDGDGAIDSVLFHYYVGDPALQGLTGPSEYGYWAVDNADDETVFPVVPEFDWVDIRSIGEDTEMSDTHNEDDESVVVELPFECMYHGEIYGEITICTNGWFAFGDCESITLFRNWPIPNANGPPAMVAAFWDDLRTNDGGVYTYHDEENGCFIIEWDCITALGGIDEEFEAIIYDPAAWPTSTGNSQILVQYLNVTPWPSGTNDNWYATVGMENYLQQDGVEYYYWEQYADGAEEITGGLAILFTDQLSVYTEPPSAAINPQSFTFELLPSLQDSAFLGITNTGFSPLIWSIDILDGELNQLDRRERLGWNVPLVKVECPEPQEAHDPVETIMQHESDNPLSSSILLNGFRVNQASRSNPRTTSISIKHEAEIPGPTPVDEYGGPDGFGYTWVDSREDTGPEFNWHSDIGTELDFGDELDDGMSQVISIPFLFPFYGQVYDEFRVCTNGYITFIGSQEPLFSNRSLPNENAPDAIIAVWWDDLDLSEGGSVYVWDNGADSIIVTFSEIMDWDESYGPFTFQLVLNDNGEIYMNYLDTGTHSDDRHDGFTIGVQNEDHSDGLTVVYNDYNADFIEDELTVRISLTRIWLGLSAEEGVVGPGDMELISVRVSSENIPVGYYEGLLSMSTNDPDHRSFEIPVSLTINPGGENPVVSDIPDQEVYIGTDFEIINLDDFVLDPHYPDATIHWEATGQENLAVIIVNRLAMITPLDPEWSGAETITFIAENLEGLIASDDATFTISVPNYPPTVFSLLTPADGDSDIVRLLEFEWEESSDPEEGPVQYIFVVSTGNDTVSVENISETFLEVDLGGMDLPVLPERQEYEWWVWAVDDVGNRQRSNQSFTFYFYEDAVEERFSIPESYALSTPYPNPFNPNVSMEIALPEISEVTMVIHDILGREVINDRIGSFSAGYHILTWNADNYAAGVYFITVMAGDFENVRKVVLLK